MTGTLVLGIESSCDETAAAVVRDGVEVLSNVVHSQTQLHERFRGVVPEVASRSHTQRILGIVTGALDTAGVTATALDAIAVTCRPGMIGSLLVGLSAAKALSFWFDKPLVGVDHIEAHLHAAFMTDPELPTPCLSLVASGGHTALYRLEGPGRSTRLGRTLDDAAGEALDKGAALLGLPYPGGPSIEQAATAGDPRSVKLPRPMLDGQSLDFSFSGMKTALLYHLRGPGLTRPLPELDGPQVSDLAAAYQEAIVDTLVKKLRRAAQLHPDARSLAIGGGVARNTLLRERLRQDPALSRLHQAFPPLDLCSDNGAMIAGLGAHRWRVDGKVDGLGLDARATSLYTPRALIRPDRKPARLVLEDGTVCHGRSFGASNDTVGELVFNTSMTGYQEILTDPSYRGQTVLLTQPHIGNYGVNTEDEESRRIWLSGLIVREACARGSNFRSGGELSDYLVQHGVPGIERVDTRMLTRRVRSAGALKVMITEDTTSADAELVERVRQAPSISAEDHVLVVTTPEPMHWTKGHESPFASASPDAVNARPEPTYSLVAYDFGAKRNILRSLVACGFDVTIVPADTPPEAVLERSPDAVFLSNGPGDPAVLDYAVRAAKTLVQKVPVFGICLGHQILGQVFGAKTFKMKFGHHGGNQPVMDLSTEKVEITAQNHSFAVDPTQLPDSVEVTHVNLNDRTVEGIRHRELPVFSVQYHPEAAPGPHDALYLFDRFRRVIAGDRGR